MKDKHQPMEGANKPEGSEEQDEDKEFGASELNPPQRIHHLERSIMFLRQQHQEVLKSLHDEIEVLKKENKGT